MRRSPNWSSRIDNILTKTQSKFDRFKIRNSSADNTADLSLKQLDTQESQPLGISKLLGMRTTMNFEESQDAKAGLADQFKDRDLKVLSEVAQLSERIAALEDGRMKDLQCVRARQTNEVIKRAQQFEAKTREIFKQLRSSANDKLSRSDFEELATSQDRELKSCIVKIEAKTNTLTDSLAEIQAQVGHLSTEVRLTTDKHRAAQVNTNRIDTMTLEFENQRQGLDAKLKDLERQLSSQLIDLKSGMNTRIADLLKASREPAGTGGQSTTPNLESFNYKLTKAIELCQAHTHRLDQVELKVDEISNRMEDIEIRTLRLDIDEIIQKRDADKDELSEALATFGKQEEFRIKKGKSSPELVTMSLNDLGESDVESNGLMSPSLSPLNRFEQVAAKLKRFVFDDQTSSIEEALNEEESASVDYSMRLPQCVKVIGRLSDRLMIQGGERYANTIISENSASLAY